MSIVIPRNVHQIWIQGSPPKIFEPYIQKWKQYAEDNGYSHRIWSGKEIEELIQSTFPKLLPYYQNADNYAKMADIGRYLILYAYGGVYADVDIEPLKNPDVLFAKPSVNESYQFVVGKECDASCGNAFIASVPRHGILQQVINKMLRRLPRYQDTIITTGPLMLTSVLLCFREYPGVKIWDAPYVYSKTQFEDLNIPDGDERKVLLSHPSIVHGWTWWHVIKRFGLIVIGPVLALTLIISLIWHMFISKRNSWLGTISIGIIVFSMSMTIAILNVHNRMISDFRGCGLTHLYDK